MKITQFLLDYFGKCFKCASQKENTKEQGFAYLEMEVQELNFSFGPGKNGSNEKDDNETSRENSNSDTTNLSVSKN